MDTTSSSRQGSSASNCARRSVRLLSRFVGNGISDSRRSSDSQTTRRRTRLTSLLLSPVPAGKESLLSTTSVRSFHFVRRVGKLIIRPQRSKYASRSLPFALANFFLQPRGRSLIAAGVWQPGSSELSTIRHSILRDPAPLRKAISEPAFVKLFGEPKAKKGARSSVYGQDDECVPSSCCLLSRLTHRSQAQELSQTPGRDQGAQGY